MPDEARSAQVATELAAEVATKVATEVATKVATLVAARVRDVPDFPTPGVLFRDLSPLLADPAAFGAVADLIAGRHRGAADLVAGLEARGFLLAGAVGYAAGLGVVLVRKAGKLPAPTVGASYVLEYGEATIEVPAAAFAAARRVLLVDDVLATGGTLLAAVDLVRRAGGEVAGVSVILDLAALGGRARLAERGIEVHAVVTL
jgi:adenine phosphoribosyltransferase